MAVEALLAKYTKYQGTVVIKKYYSKRKFVAHKGSSLILDTAFWVGHKIKIHIFME